MFFHGCVSHGLHLLVKDIFAATKTKKPGYLEPSYPNGYPFEEMLQLAADCKDLVKFFNNHHVMKTKLRQMQVSEKVTALALPAPTRWGSLKQCFQSILDSERIIYTIVGERNFLVGTRKQIQERQRLKDVVVKDDFLTNLKKALKILAPIDEQIVKFQSDAVPISEVVTTFNQLPEKFAEMTDTLTSAEITYLQNLVSTRFKLIYGDAYGIGYLLDPRFVGDGLPADNRRQLEDSLIAIPENDTTVAAEERKMILYEQLTKYVISAQRERRTRTLSDSKCYKTSAKLHCSIGSQMALLGLSSTRLLCEYSQCRRQVQPRRGTSWRLALFIPSNATASAINLLRSWSSSRQIIKHFAAVTGRMDLCGMNPVMIVIWRLKAMAQVTLESDRQQIVSFNKLNGQYRLIDVVTLGRTFRIKHLIV